MGRPEWSQAAQTASTVSMARGWAALQGENQLYCYEAAPQQPALSPGKLCLPPPPCTITPFPGLP